MVDLLKIEPNRFRAGAGKFDSQKRYLWYKTSGNQKLPDGRTIIIAYTLGQTASIRWESGGVSRTVRPSVIGTTFTANVKHVGQLP